MKEYQIELGYLVLEVPDPMVLAPVFSEVVGLVPGPPTGTGSQTWRNDRRAHRLIVEVGPASDAIAIGIEAVDTRAFEAVVGRLDRMGAVLAEGNGAERRVRQLVRTTAPWGVEVEIVLQPEDAEVRFSSPLVPGGFLTDGVGFGHLVFATTASEESDAFLTEGLGFSQSDWLETELAPGIELQVRFYHCNRRHHTIAIARAPFDLPQHLHHVMFELTERDDVGAAFDRAWASDLAIPNGLGRHDNDGMFSFYVQTPVGFQVEVGFGARSITDGWDENRRYERISAWGHQPLRTA
jgi:2,3-dihydroxybiphenyl 1,2-dioxygenase